MNDKEADNIIGLLDYFYSRHLAIQMIIKLREEAIKAMWYKFYDPEAVGHAPFFLAIETYRGEQGLDPIYDGEII